jgi:hypothetical protein
MTAQLTLTGVDGVQEALRKFGANAEREIEKAVTATAFQVDAEIKRSIQRGPKTGRTYRRGTTSHQASAPGEAPATDRGALVSSITFRKITPLTSQVESRLDYASYLEFGTQFIAPRPAWLPAIEKAQPDFARRVADAIRRAAP